MFPKLHGAFSLVYLEKGTIEETPAVLIFIRGFVFCKLKDCLVFEKQKGVVLAVGITLSYIL